ncbi:mannosyltransferase [Sinomicrobium weinanense]|uniref:Mannosyltransferase n=1 Tax=Sinomicrobium weinanense TaxID=2842200 RepID=A0A926PZR6_9FLAO|nr:mannosyltransferase [Sinomicrobium weinanense]MBC9794377.1 mannosyltransferase [Sinomicrobium weinanense]MBU3124284.1 mannosyltransferase [Sinomicrobium weinanense]
MIANYWKYHKFPVLIALGCIVLYASFAYQLVRTDFIKLITLYGALFFLYTKVIALEKGNMGFLSALALVFRVVFILSIPNLSQDFYRFIWDGQLSLNGLNPYLHLPDDLVTDPALPIANARELHEGMGNLSARHYTNYPPVNQLCFLIASALGGNGVLGPVIAMRLLIVLADAGTWYFGRKLLTALKLPEHYIFYYLLNPLIIIEFTGNLHFEGMMLFFLIWSLYLLHSGKWAASAVIMALSVSVKLIPLMLVPLVLQKLGWKKAILYGIAVCAVVLVLFLPFISGELVDHYMQTTRLWFVNFEFNGSIYYLIREIGFRVKGYNIIHSVGKVTPFIITGFILLLAFFRRNRETIPLITGMLLALSFYFFLSTTIHPWYIGTLVVLSVFTRYRFPLVWSAVIMLSYSAYGADGFGENPWLLGIEYLTVYGFFLWEVFLKSMKYEVRS